MSIAGNFAAVVLAGGAGRRMGGRLKPLLPVGGEPMLHRVLAAVTGATPIIVVGPPELDAHLPAEVRRVQENPPGGGPVAALAAGSGLCPEADHLAVVAADLPFLSVAALSQLRDRLGAGTDVALYSDDQGRWQLLCAVWQGDALRRALTGVRGSGRAMRDLLAAVRVAEIPSRSFPPPWYDCDDPDQLREAERW